MVVEESVHTGDQIDFTMKPVLYFAVTRNLKEGSNFCAIEVTSISSSHFTWIRECTLHNNSAGRYILISKYKGDKLRMINKSLGIFQTTAIPSQTTSVAKLFHGQCHPPPPPPPPHTHTHQCRKIILWSMSIFPLPNYQCRKIIQNLWSVSFSPLPSVHKPF